MQNVKIAVTATVLFFSMISTMFAQPAHMVKDLTPAIEYVGLRNSQHLVELNGIYYFEGEEPNCGKELWRTDGTRAGTWRITDLAPGAGDCDIGESLIVHGNLLYFIAGNSPAGSDQLYRSDGTTKGTIPVISSDQSLQVTEFHFSAKGELYILGSNYPADKALWRYQLSDKTMEKVADTPSYSFFLGSNSQYTYLTSADTIVRTNGTTSGTIEIQKPQSAKSYLLVEDGLWYQDGSGVWRQGNDELTPTLVFPDDFYPKAILELFSHKGKVYAFRNTSDHEISLWNITEFNDQSKPLAVFDRDNPGSGQIPWFLDMAPGEDGLYFSVPVPNNKFQIWKTDDSLSQFAKISELSGDTFYPSQCAILHSQLYAFSNNQELWQFTGAESGPKKIAHFDVDTFINIRGVSELDIYFTGEYNVDFGLWKSNGTTSGTNEIIKIPVPQSTNPDHLLSVDNHWFFLAADESGYSHWWCTTGLAEKTLKLPSGFIYARAYTVLKDVFYFASINESGTAEIWKSDGSIEGTSLFATPGLPDITAIYSTDAELYYTCFDSDSQIYSLWKLNKDGLSQHLYDFSKDYSPARSMGSIGPKLFLLLRNEKRSDDIFVTDGSSSGTKLIKSLPARSIPLEFPNASCICDDRLYVEAYDQDNGWKLWITDGNMETMDAISISQYRSNYIGGFMPLGNKVFFPVAGKGIWSSDGTKNGTGPIELNAEMPGIYDYSIYHLGKSSSSLFYRMIGGSENYLLSITDTPSGLDASRIDILPQYPRSPNPVIEFQQGCFLNSCLSPTGEELWAVKEGTLRPQLVQDIWPNGSGSPEQITPGPTGVLFTANDGIHGREIWYAPYSKIWPATAAGWELYE